MPVKSLRNTQKKKTGSKSSAVNRSNKMSRKAGTNCGGAKTKSPKKSSPSPSPENSIEKSIEKSIEMPSDLPLPKKYTNAQEKKDRELVDAQIKDFYENSNIITELKRMKTNTKEERFVKKQVLAEGITSRIPILPQEIEAGIKAEILKQMQPKIKNWEKLKRKRDKDFEKIIENLESDLESEESDYYGNPQPIRNQINEITGIWKPETSYEFNHLETAIYGKPLTNPFAPKEAAEYEEDEEYEEKGYLLFTVDDRITFINGHIRDSWNEGWRDAVKKHKPETGKITDLLVENHLVPRIVMEAYGQRDENDNESEETEMVNQWIQKWLDANDEESPEMGKDPSTSKKRKSMPAAPSAQKIRATPMPPAAGVGPTTSTETISFKDADSLARKDSNIKIRQSKTHPGNYYTVNTETNEFTWIIPIGLSINPENGRYYYMDYADQTRYINKLSRADAKNAVKNNPGKFEIRIHNTPDGNFDYLINTESGAVAKLFD